MPLQAHTPPAASPATGTQYLTADHLGSTRLVTGTAGTVQQCRDNLPFGEELPAGTSGRPACYGGSAQYAQFFQDSFATPPIPAQYQTLAAGSPLGP